MLKLNQPIKTIKGETVVPFLVEGLSVHVVDKNKNQKIMDLSEFDLETKKVNKKNTNTIIVKQSENSTVEMIEEEIVTEPVIIPEPIPIVIPEPVIIPEPIIDPIVIPDPVVIPEPITIPVVEPIITPVIERNSFRFVGNNLLKINDKTTSSLYLKADTSVADDFYGSL